MATHRETRFVPVPPEQLFDLVTDVERYPQYLSLWRSAQVYEREANGYFTEQEIGLGPIRESFRTHTTFERPTWIDVSSIDPLFKRFHIRWDFAPVRSGARVMIALTWEVRSRLLQRAIEAALPMTTKRMIVAFEEEARRSRARPARATTQTPPAEAPSDEASKPTE